MELKILLKIKTENFFWKLKQKMELKLFKNEN